MQGPRGWNLVGWILPWGLRRSQPVDAWMVARGPVRLPTSRAAAKPRRTWCSSHGRPFRRPASLWKGSSAGWAETGVSRGPLTEKRLCFWWLLNCHTTSSSLLGEASGFSYLANQ